MKTIIFDLDGTLANIDHRLHFIKDGQKDYDAFHAACIHDTVNESVAAMFRTLKQETLDYEIMIVSGRSSIVREQTQSWLVTHNLVPDMLIMRLEGDYTPDHELKRGWLREGRLGDRDDIMLVFDNRQRVVDMWREEGLTCCQVAAWKED